ncbi:MAG: hypothetical protein ACOVS5_11060, partial [Oligoflexus sp.]
GGETCFVVLKSCIGCIKNSHGNLNELLSMKEQNHSVPIIKVSSPKLAIQGYGSGVTKPWSALVAGTGE